MKPLLATKSTCFGLFIVALSTLMYQILLTRTFSATMYYHFAFAAISISMFGMTVGALLVYLLPNIFKQENVLFQISSSSIEFAYFCVISFSLQLWIPIEFKEPFDTFLSLTIVYLLLTIPFIFSGICITLLLTRFPNQISELYAADLTGAALGCVALIFLLDILDGPTACVFIAFLICIAGCLFSYGQKTAKPAFVATVFMLAFLLCQIVSVYQKNPILRIENIKGKKERNLIYEKWNAFSRITIVKIDSRPEVWGVSNKELFLQQKVEQLLLDIDAGASTVITKFDGQLKKHDYLKYDVTNVAHHIKKNANVLIIGAGGGRDVLSALVFKQKNIVGVEINKDILKAVHEKFGDFSGHLPRHPKVKFINDEARSYISRQKQKFDILQVSLIDTWAATAAGAYVLTENTLYTVEAWSNFIDKLTPQGVLSFSRWQFESPRLLALALETLKHMKVTRPLDHILMIRAGGVVTLLLSKSPFKKADLVRLDKTVKAYDFSIVIRPQVVRSLTLAKIISKNYQGPYQYSAPTDDSPFFFNMHKFKIEVFFSASFWKNLFSNKHTNNLAVDVLAALVIITTLLTFLCIILPLLLTRNNNLLGSFPYLVFFASIGLGFMFVEISQMQRLIVFLGHPVYGLSVVLFTLLLASGMGSYCTKYIHEKRLVYFAVMAFLILLFLLILLAVFTSSIITLFRSENTAIRILISIITLAPIGFFMGMAFPLGIKLTAVNNVEEITPWLWGVNGATSVLASVLAVAIAMAYGISASYHIGIGCYALAFLSFIYIGKK